MGSTAIFTATLGLCALSVRYFWKAVMQDVPRNILTIPFAAFLAIYFIIAPATNVIFDKYVDERVFTHEPVTSLAWHNLLNAVLLMLAALGARVACRLQSPDRHAEADWTPPTGFIISLALVFALSFTYGLYWIYLGDTFIDLPSDTSRFSGSILRYMFIESAPLSFCWIVSCVVLLKGKPPGYGMAIFILIVQVVLILGMASSRGARVSLISMALFTAQIYSYCLLRIRLWHMIAGILSLLVFLQLYSNYKYGGRSAFENYLSTGVSLESAEYYNDPVHFIIGDLGRSDIQAPLVMRYVDGSFTPNGFGESYLSAFALVLPKSMRPECLRPKSQIGADAQLDVADDVAGQKGVIISPDGYLVSSRIYGLLGESILNFGLYGAPLTFFLYGIASRLSLCRATAHSTWDRLLLSPFFAAIPIYLLFYDMDNLIVQAITIWAVPWIVLTGYRLAFAPR